MATADAPDTDELLWTVAVARCLFGAEMNIQVPPNLNPGLLSKLVSAGINDWGGVSPVTVDFINPKRRGRSSRSWIARPRRRARRSWKG